MRKIQNHHQINIKIIIVVDKMDANISGKNLRRNGILVSSKCIMKKNSNCTVKKPSPLFSFEREHLGVR